MNQLGDLLRNRVAQLKDRGETVRQMAERGGWANSPSTLYDHLRRTQPYGQSIREDVIERLAAAVHLDPEEIRAAAVEATIPLEGSPLQMLLRHRQIELGWSFREVATRSGLSLAYVHNVFMGDAVPSDEAADKIAVGLDLDGSVVQSALDKTRGQSTYRLPAHIAERLTPESWGKVVKAIEAMVGLDD